MKSLDKEEFCRLYENSSFLKFITLLISKEKCFCCKMKVNILENCVTYKDIIQSFNRYLVHMQSTHGIPFEVMQVLVDSYGI